ncbi:carbonyl reductase [NADPH] 1-like protein [Tanacetum coccineum]
MSTCYPKPGSVKIAKVFFRLNNVVQIHEESKVPIILWGVAVFGLAIFAAVVVAYGRTSENKCDLYNVTEDEYSRPLKPNYVGGVHCCYDGTQCKVKNGFESSFERDIYLKYTVKWLDWSDSIIPVKVFMFDATDTWQNTGIHDCLVKKQMDKRERAKERREKRRQEISLLRSIPYSEHQRWWSAETIAVVTGANRGIGFEIAHQLALQGVTVVLTSRETAVGEESAKVLQEGGLKVVFHQLDVLDQGSIDTFCAWIKENYGGIDILGFNHNVGSENSVEFADKVIKTNYNGTKYMVKAAIPLMKPNAAGARIVNVSSRLGRLNGRKNRISDDSLRQQLEDTDSISEELIDATINKFLEQVKDGNWTDGGWPQNNTDYSLSKVAVNAYTRLVARELADRPEGEVFHQLVTPGLGQDCYGLLAVQVTPEDGRIQTIGFLCFIDMRISGKFFAERREIHF